MKKLVIISILLTLSTFGSAEVIDSLLQVLKTEKQDTSRVKTLVDLGWEYSYTDLRQSEIYANKALALSQQLDYTDGVASAYGLLGVVNRSTSNYTKAIGYFKKCLELRIRLNQPENETKTYINLANVYIDMADYATAERYYKLAIEKARSINALPAEITAYTNLAAVYQDMGDYSKALDYLFQALQLNKQLKDPSQDAFIYTNIGSVYQNQQQSKRAQTYFLDALEIFRKMGRDDQMANVYNDLGIASKELGLYDQALSYYEESLRLYKKLGMDATTSMVLHNMGIVYFEMKRYDKALEYERIALSEALRQEDDDYAARCYMSLADIYNAQGNYKQAESYALKGFELNQSVGDKNELRSSFITLAAVYAGMKQYDKAFDYQKRALNVADSLNNDAINKRIGQMQAMYEADQKQNEIDNLTKDRELQDARITRQRIVNYAVVAGLLLVLVLAFISFRRYREKKRANIAITEQKEIIEHKNKEILDSIYYARRIQRALLASDHMLNSNLPEHFVLYKPKDIVSGDFYWAQKLNDGRFLFATCDCTGHGVPGAFMSLLNISKLNETVNERGIVQPDLVFNAVRSEIIKVLNPDGTDTTAKDGMDAVLCLFDFNAMTVQFAAANNPLIIVRNGKLLEFKADKFPVGLHHELKPFRLQTVPLQKGDCVYTFTDGFADQFGGSKGKKLMSRNFKDMLVQQSAQSMEAQQQQLNRQFDDWRGTMEQVDDVLVIGIRV